MRILQTVIQKKTLVTTLATSLMIALALLAVPTLSAQTGEYTGDGEPQFNIYTDVEGIGDESDFLRIGPSGATSGQFTNLEEVCDGEADLWFYVHNGAPEDYNGDDYDNSGIARDTQVRVQLPGGSSNSHTFDGTISASNATSINDTAQLQCDDYEVSVEYVTGSAEVYSPNLGTRPLSDSIVDGGSLIGDDALDGNVPGCWEYRVWVRLTVEVEKEEPKEEPKPPVCEMLDATKLSDRRIRIDDVNYAANDSDVSGVEIDFGDGTTETYTEFPQEYTYGSDGTYNVTATVLTDMGDVTSHACETTVTYETPEEPEEPEQPEEPEEPEQPEEPEEPEQPEELPVTGPASIAGLFTLTTLVSAAAHRVFTRRS